MKSLLWQENASTKAQIPRAESIQDFGNLGLQHFGHQFFVPEKQAGTLLRLHPCSDSDWNDYRAKSL
jgi:hypothetical protein